MADDGSITLDVVVDTIDAASSVDDLISKVNNLIGALRRTRDGFASIESAAKSAANSVKDLTAPTVRAMRESRAARAPDLSRDGARVANEAVDSFSHGLQSATEQARVRIAQASEAAARRMVGAAERALSQGAQPSVVTPQRSSADRARNNMINRVQNSFAGLLGVGLAIGGAEKTVESLAELDAQIARFQAVTGAADSAAQSFKNRLLQLGTSSRYATKDIADAAIELAQMGLSAQAVEEALPSIINLASSAGTSIHQATETVSAVLGSYQLDITQTTRLADLLSGALTKTRLNVQQLSVALSYSSDQATMMGVSVSELISIFAGLAQAGIRSGSQMGTGIRQLLTSFEAPSARFQAEMRKLGISMSDLDIRAHGLLGTIQILKDKGFTVGEASKALETRTISTFSALSLQLDNMKRLQTEMLLYSGATDGAAKANQSLQARAIQLTNALLELADHAFAPFLEAMKGAVSGMTSVVEVAMRLGPALPILGTGLASVAAGFAVFKGLELSQMLFSATTSMLALSAATGGAETAAVGLSAAFGPIGLGIGVLALLSTGLLYFASNADKASKRIDALKSNIQELDSRHTQTEATRNELDSSITDLLAKREELNSNALDRRNAIVDAQRQFAQLGLTVKASAGNIDDLIQAMRRLREKLSQRLPALTIEKEINTQRLVEELRRQIPQQESDRTADLAETFLGYRSRGGARVNINQALANAASQALGSDAGKIVDLITNFHKLPDNDVRSQTGWAFGRIESHLNALANQYDSTTEASKRDALNTQLSQWKSLSDQLSKAQDFKSNLQGNLMALDREKHQAAVENIQGSPTYLSLSSKTEDLRQAFADDVARVDNLHLPPDQELAQLATAQKKANEKIVALRAKAQAEVARLTAQGQNPSAVQEAYEGLIDSLSGLASLASDAEKSAHDQLKKFKGPELDARKRVLKKEIDNLSAQMRATNDPVQLDSLQALITAKLDALKAVTEDALKVAADPNDPAAQEDLQEKLQQAKQEDADLRDKLADQLLEDRKRIAEAIFSLQSKYYDQAKSSIDEEIRALTDQLKDPKTTLDKVKELQKAIDDLIQQRTALVKEANQSSYDRELLSEPNGYISAAKPGSVEDRIIEAVNSTGRSDLVPYLVQLARKESNFDVNAENGSHRGLFQIEGAAEGASVEDQVGFILPRIDDSRAAFKKAIGREPSSQELYLLHQQGNGGGTALLQNPNQLAVDALARAYGGDRAKAAAVITPNFPSADLNTLTAAAFAKHVEDFFGTPDLKGLAVPRETVLRKQRDLANQSAKDEGRNKQDETDRAAQDRAFRDLKASNQLAARRAQEQIELNNAIIGNRLIPLSDVRRLSDQSASLEFAGIGRAVNEFDQSPENANRSAGELAADRQGAVAEANDKFSKFIADEAAKISTAIREADKKNLDRLQAAQESQTKHPEKFSPLEIQQTNERVVALSRRVKYKDALDGMQSALDFIVQWTAKLSKLKDVDPNAVKQLGLVAEGYRKQLKDLGQEQLAQRQSETGSGTYSNAIAGGTTEFFKSKGLYDPEANGGLGGWISETKQMGQTWQEVLDAMDQSTSKFFVNWATGAEHGSKLWKSFASSVLESMAQIASNVLTGEIAKLLFGPLMSNQAGSTSQFSGILASIEGLFIPHALGGYIKAMASGGEVTGGTPFRDSVPALLMPGEYVLRQSAVDFVGRDNLDRINALGNRRLSETQLSRGDSESKQVVRPLSLYVVSPQAVPPPDKDTIIHYVTNDMVSGGATKTLVRQIAGGQL